MPEYNIKNMVCARCIKTVAGIFQKAGAEVRSTGLGKVELAAHLQEKQLQEIRKDLQTEGFELLDDQRSKLIEQVKNEIINLVHYGNLDEMKLNLSEYLSGKLMKDYHYLSQLFSSVQGTTIEQYFILQKMEKVKELLFYKEQTLSEIAYQLGYSSVAHLSAQFKKITGLTPSQFKTLKQQQRKPLDQL